MLRRQRVLVLRFARDVVALGDDLGGVDLPARLAAVGGVLADQGPADRDAVEDVGGDLACRRQARYGRDRSLFERHEIHQSGQHEYTPYPPARYNPG